MSRSAIDVEEFEVCAHCFFDEGLRIDASHLGVQSGQPYPHCHRTSGNKLTKERLLQVAHRFFVLGTTVRTGFGAAPLTQLNEHRYGETETPFSPWLLKDLKLRLPRTL